MVEAHRLVTGQRNQVYGPPTEDFLRIGRVWGMILSVPDIAPEVVGLMLAGMKLARLSVTPSHRDSLVDLAGYAECVDMIHQRRAAAPPT